MRMDHTVYDTKVTGFGKSKNESAVGLIYSYFHVAENRA